MDNEISDPKLIKAGEAVARLPRPQPPQGLAARTMARISSSYKPVRRVFWMIRPITHPLARIAAAAIIIYMLFPLTDVDLGSKLGMQIEQNIIGHSMGDRVEALMDGVLSNYNFSGDNNAYPSFVGVQDGNAACSRSGVHAAKPHPRNHSGT
jgi:hypothetical protein